MSHQLINQSSGIEDWITPPHILTAARNTITISGDCEFSLDPFASPMSNQWVRARRIFTRANPDEVWSIPWTVQSVWMNPPFGELIDAAIKRFFREFYAGHFTQGMIITFASTSEAWFQPLTIWPQCYLRPRLQYLDHEGRPTGNAPKGSVVTYVAQPQFCNVARFYRNFGRLGPIKLFYEPGIFSVDEQLI